MSFQGAPVRMTHRIPLSTARVGFHGRPLPSSRTGNGGISGSRIAHCSSVRSIPTINHGLNRMETPHSNAQQSRSLTLQDRLWNRLYSYWQQYSVAAYPWGFCPGTPAVWQTILG